MKIAPLLGSIVVLLILGLTAGKRAGARNDARSDRLVSNDSGPLACG